MQASGLGPDDYRVGIICALATEKMAVEGMLDEEDPGLPRQPGDDNDYTLGRIGKHRVIVACLPGGMTGNNSAAVVATNMMRSFPIRIGLMVGIAGGVWSKEKDIRLGDVIVSQPDDMHGGVVQWDFGKMEADGFKRTGTLNKPPRELLNAVQGLRSSHGRKGDTLHVHLEKMLEDNPKMRDEGNFVYQGHENDVLYEATYRHENENVKTCAQCAQSRIVKRAERVDDRPRIHYGNIASGNEVVKDGPSRDRIAEKEGVIGFEMEAAGLMDSFPCLVIRGICDYADSHKNKRWQPYAAATAAAYAKELLLRIAPDDVIQMQTASKVTEKASQPIVYIPFPKNSQFVGRKDELATLKRRLFTARDSQTLAVVGLGGMGKTQLVLNFVYAIQEEQSDISIFWIPALSAETFSQAMKEIAGLLRIHVAEGSDQDVRPLVKQRLSAPNMGKWLLVVDNADDFDVVNGLLQFLPMSNEGITVFTTRTAKVAQQVARSNVITLQKPAQGEAKELLRKALVREQDLGDVESTNTLLAELDCLPLAITQAAGYLNINSIPISEYVRLLQSADQENLVYLMKTEIRDNTRYEQAASAVATTWIVSFRQIVATDSVAADLLQFMSCIEWKAIPYSLLPTVEPEARTRNAIGTLHSYSFLSTRADGITYDMHRLVHLASRIWARDSGRTAEIQAEAIAHVSVRFPNGEWEDRETWREYMPHAERMRSQWSSVDIDRDSDTETRAKSTICTRVGCCLYKDGRVKHAVQWMQISCTMTSRLAQDDPYRLYTEHELARAYQANGQVTEAVQLLESVVKIRSRTLVEEHPDRLASQHVLAGAYQANGQVPEAVQLLESVVKIRSRILVEEHPSRLASQDALAGAYQANGQVTEAVQLLEDVVKIGSRILVEEHPDRLVSQHALARAYQANGQVPEAVQLLENVVKIRSRILGEEHPGRLASQHGLALAYDADGQTDKAVRLLEKVVATYVEYAIEHPHRLISQRVLLEMYEESGDPEKAMQLRNDIVVTKELLEVKYSKDHTLPHRSVPNVEPQLPHKKEDVSKDRRWKRRITRLFRPQG